MSVRRRSFPSRSVFRSRVLVTLRSRPDGWAELRRRHGQRHRRPPPPRRRGGRLRGPVRQRHPVESHPEPPLRVPQFLAQLCRRPGAVRGFACHRMFDAAGHLRGESGRREIGDSFARDAEEVRDHLLPAAPLERRVAGQRTEQGRAQPIDVGGHRWRRTGEEFGLRRLLSAVRNARRDRRRAGIRSRRAQRAGLYPDPRRHRAHRRRRRAC